MRHPITSLATNALFSAIRSGRLDHVRHAIRAGAELDVLDMDGALPLNLALELNDIDVVEELLDSGANPNAEADPYWIPLGLAASRGNDRLVTLLLNRGASVNMVAFIDRRTPLIHAIRHKHISTTKILLDANAQVHIRDRNGRTALIHAVLAGLEEVVRNIRDRGALVNINDVELKTARQYAEQSGRKDLVDALGPDLARYGRIDELDWKLVSAAHDGNITAMEAFLQMGASIEWQPPYGHSAIHEAAFYGQMPAVTWLMDSGASTSTQNGWDESFIFSAARGGNADIIRMAIQRGLNVNEKNQYGRSPLHVVMKSGTTEAVELLLAAGADINAKDDNGVTPLIESAVKKRADLSELLIQKGALLRLAEGVVLKAPTALATAPLEDSITVKVGEAEGSLLHYAAEFGFMEGIERLIDLGCPVDEQDNCGQTPLHLAAREGHTSAIIRLLNAGAEIDSETNHCLTPLLSAVYAYRYKSVEALIAAGADPEIRDFFGSSSFHHVRQMENLYLKEPINYCLITDLQENAMQIVSLFDHLKHMESENVNLSEEFESYSEE